MDFLIGLWLLALLIGVYFLPTIVATQRDVVNKWSVGVINLFLGWTLIGWVIALAMSMRTQTLKQGLPLSRDAQRYSAK